MLTINIYIYIYIYEEVWKQDFRQYGEMEMTQPGRNSDVENVRREKIRDGESQSVCFAVCDGSGESKGSFAKAAGGYLASEIDR